MSFRKKLLNEAINRLVEEYEGEFADEEIENPETGNEIKVGTAMSYSDEHPAKQKAVKKIKQAKEKQDGGGDDGDEDEGGKGISSDTEDKLEDKGIDVSSEEVPMNDDTLAKQDSASEEDFKTAKAFAQSTDIDLDNYSEEQAADAIVKSGFDDPEMLDDLADAYENVWDGFEELHDSDEFDDEDDVADAIYGPDASPGDSPEAFKAAKNLKQTAEWIRQAKEDGDAWEEWQQRLQDHYSPSYKKLVGEIYFK